MARLRDLVHGTNRRSSGPSWDGDQWRAALVQIAEFSLIERRLLREFIVGEALPLLPELPSDGAATKNLREGRGPGPVVLFWEEEFVLAPDQAELIRFCSVPAMLRFVAWLESTRRLMIEIDRERARASALAEARSLLQSLLSGGDGAELIWDVGRWRRSLNELTGIFSGNRGGSDALREFIVSEALPLLPKVDTDRLVVNNMREGRGPCPVVVFWEEQFRISDYFPFVDCVWADALMRYADWLEISDWVSGQMQQGRAPFFRAEFWRRTRLSRL